MALSSLEKTRYYRRQHRVVRIGFVESESDTWNWDAALSSSKAEWNFSETIKRKLFSHFPLIYQWVSFRRLLLFHFKAFKFPNKRYCEFCSFITRQKQKPSKRDNCFDHLRPLISRCVKLKYMYMPRVSRNNTAIKDTVKHYYFFNNNTL